MSVQLGATTYTSVTWTAGDTITEGKLDNMVANDQAYDSHAAQGLLLNNNKSFASRDSGGTSRNLARWDGSDIIQLGDAGLDTLSVSQVTDYENNVDDDDDIPNKKYVDSVKPPYHSVKVYKSSNQSIANATWTTLTFDTEGWDSDTFHDTATNNERLTAPFDGIYLVTFAFQFASNSTGKRGALIELNGSSATDKYLVYENANSSDITSINGCQTMSLSENDYIVLQAYQNSTGALNVLSDIRYHHFAMTLLCLSS